jgi:hypothetical protein
MNQVVIVFAGLSAYFTLRCAGDLRLQHSEAITPLPTVLDMLNIDHLEHLEDQVGVWRYPIACGYWCDSDLALLRKSLAQTLKLSPRQFGDVRLQESTAAYAYEQWDAAVLLILGSGRPASQDSHATWRNPDGTEAILPSSGHMRGAAVLMKSSAQVEFSHPVKLAIIPILPRPRPLWDYVLGSGLWKALVATHVTSGVLGLEFFRAHTQNPLFWHACVWSAIGSCAVVLLGLPLIWRPLQHIADTLHEHFDSTEPKIMRRELPTLLSKHRDSSPRILFEGKDPYGRRLFGSPSMGGKSPCTPRTDYMNSFM